MDIIQFLQSLIAGLGSWFIILIILVLVGGLGMIAFNFLAIQKFLQELSSLFQELFKLILPKKWDSAKTLLWLGIFSWAVSLLVGPVSQNIIATVGWLFLIPAVHWVMYEEKKLKDLLTIGGIFIGPWITGALVSFFLFASPNELPPIAYVSWPIISAIIAASPKFIQTGPVYAIPKEAKDRQYLVNLTLINLLLSCWIQLCFSTQDWLAEYPSLMADNLNNSSFVVKVQPDSEISSRGVDVLARAESVLRTNLEGQSWSQVERWLLNFDQQLKPLEETALSQLPRMAENSYWQVGGRILAGEYNVELQAIWRGPTADAQGYYLTKTCQISQVVPADITGKSTTFGTVPSLPTIGTAKVRCGPVTGPIRGQPQTAT